MKNIFQIIPKWIRTSIIGLALVAFSCSLAFPRHSVRYKVTVEIETPEGIKTGSAVRQLTVQHVPVTTISGPAARVEGEAVIVDLGKRGVAFAVMGTNDEYILFNSFPTETPRLPKGMRYYQSLKAKTPVAFKDRPLIVAFKDIDDPKSVTVAYRYILERDQNKPGMQFKVVGAEDNLEEIFGAGVKLKDVTIETTKEPVIWGIEKELGWLNNLLQQGARLNGNIGAILTNDLANNIGSGSFSAGK